MTTTLQLRVVAWVPASAFAMQGAQQSPARALQAEPCIFFPSSHRRGPICLLPLKCSLDAPFNAFFDCFFLTTG